MTDESALHGPVFLCSLLARFHLAPRRQRLTAPVDGGMPAVELIAVGHLRSCRRNHPGRAGRWILDPDFGTSTGAMPAMAGRCRHSLSHPDYEQHSCGRHWIDFLWPISVSRARRPMGEFSGTMAYSDQVILPFLS